MLDAKRPDPFATMQQLVTEARKACMSLPLANEPARATAGVARDALDDAFAALEQLRGLAHFSDTAWRRR